MKTIIKSAIAVTAVCLLAGCETTGLSPRESSGTTYQSYVMNLQSGSTNAPQKVSLPLRLAVAQVGEAAPPEVMLDKLAENKKLVASVSGLPLPGDVYSDSQDYPTRIKTICNLARTTGANFVFLFGGSMDSWQQNNSWSVLDATLVGGAIFPGTKIHIEGKASGALICATNCQPVLFVNTEARQTAFSPDYFAEGKTTGVRAEVRDQLAAKLTEQLMERLPEISTH